MISEDVRLDHRIIYGIVEAGSKILDLGCGNGDLMYLLAREKNARVQGIELDEAAIYECVKKGMSVIHGNIEEGLREYPDASFDDVILNQSIQQVKKVDEVFEQALRIGRRIIVGFPELCPSWREIDAFFSREVSRDGIASLSLERYAERPLLKHYRFPAILRRTVSPHSGDPLPGRNEGNPLVA